MMKLLGVRRGSGKQLTMQEKGSKIFNQITTCTISVDTFLWQLKKRTEPIWVCPEYNDVDFLILFL
jgi:hypothetical protein